ncbi:MAG: GFA family protein [Myxococcota bacterium]
MTESYTGGCACGTIRYEARGAPIVQNHCQCCDCQKRSGTGHSSYLVFAGEESFTITGTPSTWAVTGDSGNDKVHAFCGTCGTPVSVTFAAMPGVVAFHAASLDEPARFAPALVTYRRRALPWDRMAPELQGFDEMPPSG